MSPLEIGVSVFGVIYVALATRSIVWCWPAGIISAVLCIVFDIQLKYYLDAILQAYYVVAGFYGWYLWTRKEPSTNAGMAVSSYSFRRLMPFLLLGVVLTPLFGFGFSKLGNSYAYLDAFTAVFSFITTYLTAKKILESWVLWVVIDLALVGQYLVKNANIMAFFYLFITIMAIYGYIEWRKQIEKTHDI